MTLWLIVPGAVSAQTVMWLGMTRVHYRHFQWLETTKDDHRRMWSGLWGFLWPVTAAAWAVNAALLLVSWNMTRPSRAEVRRKREQELAADVAHIEREWDGDGNCGDET